MFIEKIKEQQMLLCTKTSYKHQQLTFIDKLVVEASISFGS